MLESYPRATVGEEFLLILFPGVIHNAWDYVFQEPELLPWLFSNKK